MPTLKTGADRARKESMDRQTLSIMKACEAVGVSRRTIYNWISAGKVEYVRTAGGINPHLRRHAVARRGLAVATR